MAAREEVAPLLAEEGGVRRRAAPAAGSERYQPGNDWDPELPYGGKVYLARRKKADPWWVTAIEATVIISTVAFSYYAFYYFENLHFHITHGYAHLGYSTAQHQVGQRFLHGKGVEKDEHKAMEWFKKASDQGHHHASYNLAIGHLKGIRKDILKPGEPKHLISKAAENGVHEANHALNNICLQGGCE